MNRVNFQALDAQTFKDQCNSLAVADIKEAVKQMDPEQIPLLIELFASESFPEGEEKLTAALAALSNHSSLELAGRAMTPCQFFTALTHKKKIETSSFRKIPPLLVGMPFKVFLDILLEMPQNLLQTLQEEGHTEPLQHHLTLFCHDLAVQLERLHDNLLLLENELDEVDTKKINHELLLSIHRGIKEWEVFANKNLIRIQNAFSIAWNTNRTDLIDGLSFQKEAWKKYDTLVIGSQRTYDTPASGLYARLESRLNTVFSNPEDPNDIEALQDNEPAIEALVKFSLWYLHDYFEVGLLPQIKHPSQLDLDPATYSDKERADYRAKLFQEAQHYLEMLGLKKVRDFKSKQIYSKEMLQEYLKNHAAIISTLQHF